jgi:hypothetical protein
VYRWRYKVVSSLEHEPEKWLYKKYPELFGYFVKGAPVFLTENINPNKGLANGTAAIMHSMSWTTQVDVTYVLAQAENMKPGTIIDVDMPNSINIEIPIEQLTHSRNTWTKEEGQTLTPGRVIIPLSCTSHCKLSLAGQFATKHITYNEFPYDLAFVGTFHKFQGRTIRKVILDLNKQPNRMNVCYASLYVGMSRVRSGEDIRLFPHLDLPDSSPTLFHLKRLKANDNLIVWYSGFTGNREGIRKWSIEKVIELYKDVKRVPALIKEIIQTHQVAVQKTRETEAAAALIAPIVISPRSYSTDDDASIREGLASSTNTSVINERADSSQQVGIHRRAGLLHHLDLHAPIASMYTDSVDYQLPSYAADAVAAADEEEEDDIHIEEDSDEEEHNEFIDDQASDANSVQSHDKLR